MPTSPERAGRGSLDFGRDFNHARMKSCPKWYSFPSAASSWHLTERTFVVYVLPIRATVCRILDLHGSAEGIRKRRDGCAATNVVSGMREEAVSVSAFRPVKRIVFADGRFDHAVPTIDLAPASDGCTPGSGADGISLPSASRPLSTSGARGAEERHRPTSGRNLAVRQGGARVSRSARRGSRGRRAAEAAGATREDPSSGGRTEGQFTGRRFGPGPRPGRPTSTTTPPLAATGEEPTQ